MLNSSLSNYSNLQLQIVYHFIFNDAKNSLEFLVPTDSMQLIYHSILVSNQSVTEHEMDNAVSVAKILLMIVASIVVVKKYFRR